MKKKIGRTILKLLFYLSYPLLIAGLIGVTTVLIVKTRELDDIKNTLSAASEDLRKEQISSEDLRSEFQSMTQELSSLRSENADLKETLNDMQLTGYGTISGKIFPFVTNGIKDFTQYQRVCAESTTNSNIQICKTVSALQQNYTLSVPVGTYNIFAELFPTPEPGTALADARGYYTDYVACVQDQGVEQCSTDQSAKIDVEVKVGDNITNVDPIDWRQG